jgi:hypothetical protein
VRALAAALALVALAAAFAGCGKSKSKSYTPPAWLKRGDAACAKVRRTGSGTEPRDAAKLATYTARQYTAGQEILTALRPLTPPAKQRRLYARFVRIVGQRVAAFRAARDAAARGDAKAARAALARDRKRYKSDYSLLAFGLGFAVCGQ